MLCTGQTARSDPGVSARRAITPARPASPPKNASAKAVPRRGVAGGEGPSCRATSKPAVNRTSVTAELGYVPLSPGGAELLFETFSQRYERGWTIVSSNLPFEDWTSVLGSERLTGALLDRLTHHVSILSMNGDSYRLKQSAGRRRVLARAEKDQATAAAVEPGEIVQL